MFHPPLTHAERESFEAALVAPTRIVRFGAQLFNKAGEPLPTKLTILDGEVVIDNTARKTQPSRTAHVTLIDPHRQLVVDIHRTDTDKIWFSRQLGVRCGIWVADLALWVDIPVFRGWITDVERHGLEVDIDCAGKESQHLDPYFFKAGYSTPQHTRYSAAIKNLFEHRGETHFEIETVSRRLTRARSWKLGLEPWKAGQNLADDVDHQLYYRGTGALRLRKIPQQPAWRFREGRHCTIVERPSERLSIGNLANTIVVRGERTVKVEIKTETELSVKAAAGDATITVVSNKNFASGRKVEIGAGDSPEVRKIASVSGTTITLAAALSRKHVKGARVRVVFKDDRTRRVVGRAALPSSHPLSGETLTGDKRPRIRIEDRSHIHKKAAAQDKADALMQREAGALEISVALSTVPIYHLEEADVIDVETDDVVRSCRLDKMTIPLNVHDVSEINWDGKRVPRRRRRRRHRRH